MLSITRTFAMLCIVPLASLAFLGVAPVFASSVVFTANPPVGSDSNPCSAASPCQTLQHAKTVVDPGGQITCAQGTAFGSNMAIINSMTIDCPGVMVTNNNAFIDGIITGSYVFRLSNLVINGQFAGAGAVGVAVISGGTLIFENCVFENFSGNAISIAPSTIPTTIILRNTRLVNNAGGILLKPSAGVSIKATLDHVVITANTAGGLKIDSTNGPVSVDVTNSEISNNGANGLNAVGGAGGPAVFNIEHSVIAKNGQVGVVVNGATAAAMIDTTLLDSNTTGATLVAGGGHMLTYGNNRIVGSSGSGFTSGTPLQ